MIKKIDILRSHLEKSEYKEAILLAAKFPRLGKEKEDILKAREAILRPDFQRQLGRDIDALIENGKKAVISKYEKKSNTPA